MNPPDRTLIYRVSRGGHVMGEFDIDRIVDLLDSGEFLWTDLFWCQGMSGWTPLANLRSEVAAAKAFPPVAAMPAAVASGRRPRQPVAGAPVAAPKSSAGSGGWWWIVAGVSLGALIGLLITHFFPTVVQIDRPVDRVVEKIVEKPVEVVRVVEKRVEVPAQLTPAQLQMSELIKAREDAFKRDVGWGATAMVPVVEKKVRVVVDSQVKDTVVSSTAIRARVESVLRRNGFVIVAEGDKDVFAATMVIAELYCADINDADQVSGGVRLTVKQYCLIEGGSVQKLAWVTTSQYGMTIHYGSRNFYKIPALFDDFAVEASNDLLKAGPLPYSK
jgi:hypothetical protein